MISYVKLILCYSMCILSELNRQVDSVLQGWEVQIIVKYVVLVNKIQ